MDFNDRIYLKHCRKSTQKTYDSRVTCESFFFNFKLVTESQNRTLLYYNHDMFSYFIPKEYNIYNKDIILTRSTSCQ